MTYLPHKTLTQFLLTSTVPILCYGNVLYGRPTILDIICVQEDAGGYTQKSQAWQSLCLSHVYEVGEITPSRTVQQVKYRILLMKHQLFLFLRWITLLFYYIVCAKKKGLYQHCQSTTNSYSYLAFWGAQLLSKQVPIIALYVLAFIVFVQTVVNIPYKYKAFCVTAHALKLC